MELHSRATPVVILLLLRSILGLAENSWQGVDQAWEEARLKGRLRPTEFEFIFIFILQRTLGLCPF